MYKPPYDITNKMLKLSISITEKIGLINSFSSLKRMPVLRKNNKIKSIHSSLAIEANSLSLSQVKDVIDGKVVLGPKKEIQEVKNAYLAYSSLNTFDGYLEEDLLRAHSIMTYLIDDESGKYRNHGEGVFDGDKVIFVAPPENMVPTLMNDLFEWLKKDNDTPILIKFAYFIMNLFSFILLVMGMEELQDCGKMFCLANGIQFLNIFQSNLKFKNINLNTMKKSLSVIKMVIQITLLNLCLK